MFWWAHENELHRAAYSAPLDDPGALEPLVDEVNACDREHQIIDFDRRAWLHEELSSGETGGV